MCQWAALYGICIFYLIFYITHFMDEINYLEQLVVAIEQAGANLAPTYQEYMPLAFAVANSCGEAGRSLFHRICRISPKYRQADADKLYGHALQNGRGGNSLGTVFHLAERAGVRPDKNLANWPNLQAPPPHTRTCESTGRSSVQPPTEKPVDPAAAGAQKMSAPLPCFTKYRWPAFLQQVIDCGDTPAQQDILLLGAVTVFGATINKLISFSYGRKNKYPCLQTFVIAPPAAGKGALTWVRRLAEPLHNALMETYYEKLKLYRCEKAKWDVLGKEKGKTPEPEQPRLKMFLIAGDNSGSGMLENLMDAEGAGLICETEADTVSSAIGADYGHWSDTLRKSFDHERLAYNRRTNHEYRECQASYLSILISGTPAQVKPLIPSAENGLFSRQVFYCMPPIHEWADQFDSSDTDYDRMFSGWGIRWKQWLDAIKGAISGINMKLSDAQKSEFNLHFSRVFQRAGIVHGDRMKSTVARIAINICRIMGVVALLRSLYSLLMSPAATGTAQPSTDTIVQALLSCPGLSPAPHIPQENVQDGVVPQLDLAVSDDDFHAVLSLVEPLYRHSCHVFSFLPADDAVQRQAMPQEGFLDLLPLCFTRSQALQTGSQCGLSPGTLDSLLKRMTDKGQLLKTGRGEYEFRNR